MAIKSINNNKGYFITPIIIGLLLILSFGMVKAYPVIKDRSDEFEVNFLESEYFLRDLYRGSYALYYDTLVSSFGKEEDAINTIVNVSSNNNYEVAKRDVKYYLESWNRTLKSDFKNLEYYAVGSNGKGINTNTKVDIKSLLNKNEADLESLKSQYRFFATLEFDEKGNLSINNEYGVDGQKVANEIDLIKFNYARLNSTYIEPIKNMKIVYAIPKELKYDDNILYYSKGQESNSYISSAMIFMNCAIVLVVCVALFIPFRIARELIGVKKFNKIPLEINIVLSALVAFLLLYGLENIIRITMSGELTKYLAGINITGIIAGIGSDILNVMAWAALFLSIFYEIIFIRNIFNTGFRAYARESVLICKLGKRISLIKDRLMHVDLNEKNNKVLIRILLVNLFVVVIMCSIWFFGIILAIPYTITLFLIIEKRFSKIQRDYDKVLEQTRRISSGNLDLELNEDVGIFESYKDELKSLQSGFKSAVNEEVKSQNMKTELISNVSHDLKTPLTSIITYIDLLKNEDLSKEKRELYLNTLDRKSLRLQALIEDLFEVSKATSGNITLNIEEVDIVYLMKETLLELGDKLEEASLTVRSNFPEGKVILSLDSQRSFRVFENLVLNITKYSMPGSRAYIDIIDNKDNVQVILKNMASEEITFNPDEIVERFVRGDKSRNTQGSGLGLAIAKSFVNIQGGDLNIYVDGDLFKVIITFNK